MDLIVWLTELGQPFGFQLCYDKGGLERAITWEADKGFIHAEVDSGDNHFTHHKQAPILRPGGIFDKDLALLEFSSSGSELPAAFYALIQEVLEAYPASPVIGARRPQKRHRKGEKRPWWWR